MKKLLCLLPLLLLVACRQRVIVEAPKVEEGIIQGQTFIALEGGNTIKLSLVPIGLYDASVMRAHVQASRADYEAERVSISKKWDKAKERREALEAQRREVGLRLEIAKGSLTELTAKIEQTRDMYLTRWSSLSQAGRTNANAQIYKLISQKPDLENAIRRHQAAFDEFKVPIRDAEAECARCGSDYLSLNMTDFVFKTIPAPILSTQTDADGKFELRIKKGNYTLVANTYRSAGDQKENYFWIVPAKDNPNLLNNSNLLK